MLKVGDTVVWSSSSNASTKVKRGTVEVVIPPKTRLTPAQQADTGAYSQFRDHESYLVRVPGKTSASKGKLYWPRVSALVSGETLREKAPELSAMSARNPNLPAAKALAVLLPYSRRKSGSQREAKIPFSVMAEAMALLEAAAQAETRISTTEVR